MAKRSKSFITAHHEAAHAVVNYRACGHAGGYISIVADEAKGFLGIASDGVSDGMNQAHMEARILSCYAGGHAQRRVDPTTGNDGCEVVDEIARNLLLEFGWQNKERALRDRARELVNQHWTEIAAVAMELLKSKVLDDTEVETLADIASGEASTEDLARYRLLKGGA